MMVDVLQNYADGVFNRSVEKALKNIWRNTNRGQGFMMVDVLQNYADGVFNQSVDEKGFSIQGCKNSVALITSDNINKFYVSKY